MYQNNYQRNNSSYKRRNNSSNNYKKRSYKEQVVILPVNDDIQRIYNELNRIVPMNTIKIKKNKCDITIFKNSKNEAIQLANDILNILRRKTSPFVNELGDWKYFIKSQRKSPNESRIIDDSENESKDMVYARREYTASHVFLCSKVDDEYKILMGEDDRGWTLPGGKWVSSDEIDPKKTALRKLEEEFGINDDFHIDIYEKIQNQLNSLSSYWRGRRYGGYFYLINLDDEDLDEILSDFQTRVIERNDIFSSLNKVTMIKTGNKFRFVGAEVHPMILDHYGESLFHQWLNNSIAN